MRSYSNFLSLFALGQYAKMTFFGATLIFLSVLNFAPSISVESALSLGRWIFVVLTVCLVLGHLSRPLWGAALLFLRFDRQKTRQLLTNGLIESAARANLLGKRQATSSRCWN